MTTNNPTVSILMTSYNREKYIGEAIESVRASWYQHWELIIVDDQSRDKTVAIAQTYAAQDARIKVYINNENLGDYPNRNRAATYATGKYLKYVDADDKIYPHGLSVMVAMMEQYPEAGFGICTIPRSKELMYPVCLDPKELYEHNYLQKKNYFLRSPLSIIMKKEAFTNVKGFITERMVGDFDMWHRLALTTSAVIMPQGLIWHRTHQEQESNSHSKFLFRYLQLAEQHIAASQLDEKDKVALLRKIRRNQFTKLVKNPMKFSLTDRYKLWKSSRIKLTELLIK